MPAFIEGARAQTIRVGDVRSGSLSTADASLWATDPERDVVVRVDPRASGVKGGVVRVPEDPAGIATGGDGRIWVTSSAEDTLVRLESR